MTYGFRYIKRRTFPDAFLIWSVWERMPKFRTRFHRKT